MHTQFIAFVSFASYATGVVTIRSRFSKGSHGAVHPLETLLALAIVSCGVFLRKAHYSPRSLAFYALGMVFVGAAIGGAVLPNTKHVAAGTREYGEVHVDTKNRSVWKRWLGFSRAVVDYEFRLLLLVCYLLIIGPLAIVFRLERGKSAHDGRQSAWLVRNDDFSGDAAWRPF